MYPYFDTVKCIAIPAKLHYHVTVDVRTPGKQEYFIVETVKSNSQTFRDRVVHCQVDFTIDMKCITLTWTVMDTWDLANIQLDMTSGAFKQRLIFG